LADHILQAFNRWGYYPLILIGSWAFATVNRLYDFANPGHKIFWLSFLDIGFAGLMVSCLMLFAFNPGCSTKVPLVKFKHSRYDL
jgi:hypothetical protein